MQGENYLDDISYLKKYINKEGLRGKRLSRNRHSTEAKFLAEIIIVTKRKKT